MGKFLSWSEALASGLVVRGGENSATVLESVALGRS